MQINEIRDDGVMADKKKLSVEEVLAACRKQGAAGGGGSASSPGTSSSGTSSSGAPSSGAPSNEEPAKVSDKETAAGKSAKPAADKSVAKPATKPAAPAAAKPGSMNIADILAAARAEKAAGGGTPAPETAAKKPAATPKASGQPAAEKKPVEKKVPAEKKDAAKPAAAKASPSAPSLDTASILSAARQSAKPGPMSKSEAAAIAKPAEEKSKSAIVVPPMPQKPAYAQARPASRPPAETRRGFFASVNSMIVGSALAMGFASLAVTQILWVLGLARFMFPNILTEPPTRFKVGFPDVLGLGQVDEKFKALFGVWIVKSEYEGQAQVFALKSVCTHLGCTPNWLEAEQKFKCPCHGSGFYKDGVNFEGPAPRPLERYAIRVADDGQLEVDKSRVFHEELGQWKDGASFVPV